MDRVPGSGGNLIVPAGDDATWTALLQECGLFTPASDAELDRWVAAVHRNTGAVAAALCVYDGSEHVVRSVWPAPDPTGAADRLAAGETFEDRLRTVAGNGSAPCVVAEHPIVVDGRTVGQVAIADQRRPAWSAHDRAALADAAQSISATIQNRLAGVQVARVQQLVESHNHVYDMMARGLPLRETLTAACEAIERYDPSLLPSVLMCDRDSNTLCSGVGPSFPQAYLDAVEGAPIGPTIGTCGPAAWFGRLTISENLDEDPNWAPIRGLSTLAGVAHCWSMPIMDSDDVVQGTLAFYGRSPRAPLPEHLALLQDWARVVGAAIERSRSLDRLTHDARHDGLTGLPNRAAIMERLEGALRHAQPDAAVAVLFVDLDGLKAMNDTLGHNVADDMLRTMGHRLSTNMRGNDFVGRLGGDEFVAIAEGVSDPDEAARLGARLLQVVAEPLPDISSVVVTASIGIALFHGGDIDAREALRTADEAMYEAKRAGKDCCVFAKTGQTVRAGRRLQLGRQLRGAEARGETSLVYQPIVSLSTGGTTGVEALLRWTNPEFGEVEPAEFIPIAEDTGIMVQLGAWMLRESCEAVARLTASGHHLDLSVNMSARQVSHPDFAMWVRQTLVHADLPADRLILDITESCLTPAADVTVQNLRELRSLGVRIALDDVGAGHMSLPGLRDGLLDMIKIDRSLIAGLDHDHDQAIVAAVIGMVHALGCTVTAEGVETEAQLHQLRALGCDQAQGFHLARPDSEARLPELLAEARPVTAAVEPDMTH